MLKNHGNVKNRNNFLTLKLSNVYFEVALLVCVVFIKLKEVVGSKLRAFNSFMEEWKNVLLVALVLGFSKRYNVIVLVEYFCSNRMSPNL